MIWHIFRKDWKLFRIYGACVAALNAIATALQLKVGLFPPEDPAIIRTDIGASVIYASLFAAAALIVAIIHEDSLVGVRKDWLGRPISRKDLLLAKLLAIAVLVLLPFFATGLAGALSQGLGLGLSLIGVLRHTIHLALVAAPIVAIASITRSMVETIAATSVMYVGAVTLSHLRGGSIIGDRPPWMVYSWFDNAIQLGAVIGISAGVIGLQYFRRKTGWSRGLAVAGQCAFLIAPLSFSSAIALQEKLSSPPVEKIGLEFTGDRAVLGERSGPLAPVRESEVVVILPIRATALPDQSLLIGESSRVRITAEGEAPFQSYRLLGFQFRNQYAGDEKKPASYVIVIPRAYFERVAQRPVRLDLTASLSLLEIADQTTNPAVNGTSHTPGLGYCGTQMRSGQIDIAFSCLNVVPAYDCMFVTLEHPKTGVRNRDEGTCHPNYAPMLLKPGFWQWTRSMTVVPFGDPESLSTYPVQVNMLDDAVVHARMYRHRNHFESTLTIPEIRLADWRAR